MCNLSNSITSPDLIFCQFPLLPCCISTTKILLSGSIEALNIVELKFTIHDQANISHSDLIGNVQLNCTDHMLSGGQCKGTTPEA